MRETFEMNDWEKAYHEYLLSSITAVSGSGNVKVLTFKEWKSLFDYEPESRFTKHCYYGWEKTPTFMPANESDTLQWLKENPGKVAIVVGGQISWRVNPVGGHIEWQKDDRGWCDTNDLEIEKGMYVPVEEK